MTTDPIIYSPPSTQPPLYYRLALQLAKPLYRFKVWQRSHKSPKYQKEVNERFGRQYHDRPNYPAIIWCHAVSLGETNTIAPMIDELLAQGYGIWMTNTTQTGYDRVGERFNIAIKKGQLTHSYVPIDTPKVVERFLDHIQPCAALFVETELWPVMLAVLNQRNIPAILVNGRLSASSFANYQRFSAISHNMMDNISLVIAQDGDSAKRFRGLHLESKKIRVAASLKWSIQSTQQSNNDDKSKQSSDKLAALKAEIFQNDKDHNAMSEHYFNRPTWVAASTHAGEEEIVIKAHQRLIQQPQFKNTLLILVPRHPERFDEVADLLANTGLKTVRRSSNQPITTQTSVYLADTMGELMGWYALADVAFIGGSLVDVGGHNPIEAASVATPVIMGAYTKSCQVLVDTLSQANALVQIGVLQSTGSNTVSNHNNTPNDQDSLVNEMVQVLIPWLSEKKLAIKAGQRGQELVQKKQSAVFQQLSMIQPYLPNLDVLQTGSTLSEDNL